jgi:hypothetical protein
MPPCRSPHSPVAAPFPSFPEGHGGKEGPQQFVAHAQGPSVVMAGGATRAAPPTDVFQSSDRATPVVRNQNVDLSRAKLS